MIKNTVVLGFYHIEYYREVPLHEAENRKNTLSPQIQNHIHDGTQSETVKRTLTDSSICHKNLKDV